MRTSYIVQYACKDIWHSSNRPFSIMNILAISVSIGILIILLGGFLAFRQNSDELIKGRILKIEVSAREERKISDEQRSKLESIAGKDSVFWWTPTVFLFYNKKGSLQGGMGGQTVNIKDPIMSSLHDVRSRETVKFYGKEELNTSYDEIGLIMPFSSLKRLGYFGIKATLNQPETWDASSIPDKLKIRIKGNQPDALPVDVEVPLIGVVSDVQQDRYLLTGDCYQILGPGWKNEYRSMLVDRHGKSLFAERLSLNKIVWENSQDDTHATVYAQNRNQLLPFITHIREMGLKANCPLENYLQKYQQQEAFFMVAAGFICLSLFFFAGVVLFANFHALVLRKNQEIGILKACGASKALISRMLTLETAIICVLSIGIGITTGLYAGNRCSKYISMFMQEDTLVYDRTVLEHMKWFFIPMEYLVIIFIFGIFFGLVVTLVPVRNAASIDPDQVIRV